MNPRADVAAPPSLDRLLEHREGVFRICLGFCSSYEEAEDLAQDVYVKAVQSLAHLEKAEAAKFWLFRIAKNAGLDHRKKVRRRGELLRTWAKTVLPPGAARPEITAEPDERLPRLKAAVRRLPSRFREVFVLREYGHLSYEEIASMLGIGTGTVMSRLARARKKVVGSITRGIRNEQPKA